MLIAETIEYYYDEDAGVVEKDYFSVSKKIIELYYFQNNK